MILTCPACDTQYRLKDGAIPPEGRQVRCAACKHKWHESGSAEPVVASEPDEPMAGQWPVSPEPAAARADDGIGGGPPQPAGAAEEPVAAAPAAALHGQMIADNPEPEVPHPEQPEAYDDAPPAAAHAAPVPASEWDTSEPSEDHDFSSIPAMHEDDEEPRRSKLGWIIGLILIVIAAAAAFYFFAPPELKARAGIAEAGGSPLQLMLTTSDRQKLASGNELLAISGRVINSTDREQAVPPIHAELRDPTNNRLVYEWTIAPPARSLAPGAAASFNSAEVNVPQGGESLSLRFAS